MNCVYIIDEATGVCINRAAIEAGAQWAPPEGTYVIEREWNDASGHIGWIHSRETGLWEKPAPPPVVDEPPVSE